MRVLPRRHLLLSSWRGEERFSSSGELLTRQRRRRSVPLRFDPDSRLADLSALDELVDVRLLKGIDAAREALRAVGLLGLHAKLIVLVDDSGSMSANWKLIQQLLVRLVGFGLLLSPSVDEATIPMLAYGRYDAEPIIIHRRNYPQAAHLLQPTFQGTPMAEAFERAVELSWHNDTLTIIINLTDGWPDREQAMTNNVIRFGGQPGILKNVALTRVPFLDRLDDMPSRVQVCTDGQRPLRDRHGHLLLHTNPRGRRLIDNVSSVVLDPRNATDLQFAQAIAREIKEIIEVMARAGLLRGVPGIGRRYWYVPGRLAA